MSHSHPIPMILQTPQFTENFWMIVLFLTNMRLLFMVSIFTHPETSKPLFRASTTFRTAF
jgi:hypothetical protein